jgi:thiopurine S-methyltransferase
MRFWDDKWHANASGMPRWDLGNAHPLLKDLIVGTQKQGSLPHGGRILVPGAGRAHDAWALSRQGFKVHAIDIVPKAVELAQQLYPPDDSFTIAIGDVFAAGTTFAQEFDGVFDRAMLCALDASRRVPYVESMAAALKPGGVFMSLTFQTLNLDREGPPFAIAMDELYRLMSPKFTLLMAESRQDGAVDEIIVSELVNVWRRS